MATVSEKVSIAADSVTVFRVYTERMSEWWPWKGKYRYTFAPEGVEPDKLIMEPEVGGRLYEQFANGTEHQIGSVTVWKPHHEVAYTWEVEKWDEPSTVTVRFLEEGGQTTVVVEHSNLPDDATAMGYSEGHREILGAFANLVEG
jgi:uncharacterized protein YndB with AHSA1/START domain